MTQHEHHFTEFQPHTRLKHAILDSYIVAWAMKMFMRSRAVGYLGIVDAFAGPGSDTAGQPGSPLIIQRRAVEATSEAAARKPALDPRIRIFAVEQREAYFASLQRAMGAPPQNGRVLSHALKGELGDHIDAIEDAMLGRPCFYFLDPFGIQGLDANTYSKALAGPHNEMFVLFNNIGAVRLHGVVTAARADPSRTIEEIRSMPSLFPDDDLTLIAAAEQDAERANRALDASVPASREHLVRALGGDRWLDELRTVRPSSRADAFLRLFRDVLLNAGARYVLTVPIRNDDGRRVYALVHASKSAAGYITMKDSVSAGLRRDTISSASRDRIVQDIAVDLDSLIGQLASTFEGQSVPWSGHNGAVRETALRESGMFQVQANELKKRLRDLGVLRRAERKEICVFSKTVDG